jgi:apolipoprotein N-acyltransferase
MFKQRPIGIWVFFAGVPATFAGAPFFVWPLGVATLAFLYSLVRDAGSKRQAFGAGILWGMGWQLSALYWLPRAFYMDADNDIWAAVFGGGPALIGLALYGALGIALVCVAAFAAGPKYRSVVFAGGWVLVEFLKSLSPYGFPWLPLGAWLVNMPVMAQLASVGGVYLLSLILVGVAVLVSRKDYVRYGVAAVVLLAVAGFGAWRLQDAPVASNGPLIRVVQPGIHGLHKWDPNTRYAFLQRTLAVAFPDNVAKKPDVIVMPETAVAFYLNEQTDIRQLVAGKLQPGQTLLTGTVRREIPPLSKGPEDVLFYNSLVAMDASGKLLDVYDKHLLVPFGEEIPFHDWLNRLPLPFGLHTVSESRLDYARGTAPTLLNTPAGPVIGLICYEGIFPLFVARWAGEAKFLVNITNDNWFTGTIALDQHAALARLRAIETGKPLVRAANTGLSLVVDGYGRTMARLPEDASSLMDVPLPPAAPRTLFLDLADRWFE